MFRIDTHVHCRDEEQKDKATIAGTLQLAHEQGIGIIFDMPNTARPVIDERRVVERLALVPSHFRPNYRTFVGMTEFEGQQKEAVRCVRTIAQVVGIKMFAGESVGDLAIIGYEAQSRVYENLTRWHYAGVLPVHCEKQKRIQKDLWDPNDPVSHTRARPAEAEIESVRDQIQLAWATGFSGHLHICHVSTPEAVVLVNTARAAGMRISCGVTPHHLMWDETKMSGEDGLLYKMNPPLRALEDVKFLRWQLTQGMIDWIETDHAPHTPAEKQPPQCLSGYPSMNHYRQFVSDYLPKLWLTAEQIHALTYDNIVKVFGSKI